MLMPLSKIQPNTRPINVAAIQNCITASVYNVMDIDDLREPMQQINNEFKELIQAERLQSDKVVSPFYAP